MKDQTKNHNASFPSLSTNSGNKWLIRGLLTNCFYGYCLIRVLHNTHIMRWKYPLIAILIIKLNLESAYRRLHVTANLVLATITIIKQLAYQLIWLPFGVANGPCGCSIISEAIFDLSNDILRGASFDPDDLPTPIQLKLDKPDISYPSSAPYG